MGTRNPVVSGIFYEADKEELRRHIDEMMKKAKVERNYRIVISPHAGYIYSGLTAAHALGSLWYSERILILGPNHNGLGHEFSIYKEGTWSTPFGPAYVDKNLAEKLLECEFIKEDEDAHLLEHSIEVQIPILQRMFDTFTFTPLSIYGGYTEDFLERCKAVGEYISGVNDNFSMVVSSDFSHYLPRKEAEEKDSQAISFITKPDPDGFFRLQERIDSSICGYAAITVALVIAKKWGLRGEVIHLSLIHI